MSGPPADSVSASVTSRSVTIPSGESVAEPNCRPDSLRVDRASQLQPAPPPPGKRKGVASIATARIPAMASSFRVTRRFRFLSGNRHHLILQHPLNSTTQMRTVGIRARPPIIHSPGPYVHQPGTSLIGGPGMPRGEKFSIGIIQTTCSSDPQANLDKTVARIREAAKLGSQVICTQELFRSQYFCQLRRHRHF